MNYLNLILLIYFIFLIQNIYAYIKPNFIKFQLEENDIDIISLNTDENDDIFIKYIEQGVVPSTGRSYNGYLAIPSSSDQLSIYPPRNNFINNKNNKLNYKPNYCSGYAKTSVNAQINHCKYATNGGFFVMNSPTSENVCLGQIISDENILQINDEYLSMPIFGYSLINMELYTGFVQDMNDIYNYNMSQLISGSGWLVRNGESYLEQSPDLDTSSSFVLEKAPRTAIGSFKNGTIALFQVDGEEDIDEGLDLYEFTEILIDLGLYSVINLDGGGSSVSWANGEVISQPTCVDTSEICERRVTTITCLH